MTAAAASRPVYASGVPDSRPSRLRPAQLAPTRLARSPWLRAGLLAGAVGLAVYGLASQWPEVHAALAKLDGYDVAGAALCVIAGLGCMLLAWRTLLADLGSPLPLPAAIRVMFIGQLGKYVPGAVWALAAQVELARDYDVPRRRSAAASLVGMATTLVVGLIAAGVMLPLTSGRAAVHYWWVLAVTPLVVACLHPKIIKFGLDLVLRVLRKAPLEESVSSAGMARALAWATLGWLCFGAHAWFLISVFAGKSPHVFALSLGGYALAWSVGFLIIFFPGGIGPREIALIAVLAPGHVVRVRAGRRARLPGRHDDRRPVLGRDRPGLRPGAAEDGAAGFGAAGFGAAGFGAAGPGAARHRQRADRIRR